jgi:hypothetical protein
MWGPKVKSFWTVFAFALIAMILVALGIGLAWGSASQTVDGTSYSEYYYITQTACGTTAGGSTSCVTLTSNVPGGFYAAEALIIVGLVLAVILTAMSVLGPLGLTLKGWQPRLTLLFGILAFPITLAAPFVFLATTYNNSSGYSGLFVSPQTAGAGWYCAIVGGVFLLIFFFLAWKSLKEQKMAIAAGAAMSAGATPAYAPGYAPAPAPAPVMAPPPPAPTPAAPSAPNCPKCGRPTTFIAEYQRYYCYNDQQYV